MRSLPIVLALAACTGSPESPEFPDGRPNPTRPDLVLVMLDDMGFSDFGCYGGEIRTPTIDGLAENGLRFTQFYNGARCCPTRASLLTGLHPHQAGVGWMMADNGYDGYRGSLSRDAVTIAEALGAGGYGTYMSGKWHVAQVGQDDNRPRERGFDRFFGTIHGAGSFYDPNTLTLDDDLILPDEDFYYTDAITEWGIRFIDEHCRNRSEDPMFLYLAHTAPHWPMHALPEDIARYEGRYDQGWDALREERLARMIDMGIVEASWGMTERDSRVPAWEEEESKEWQVRRMEVYAAMIDRVDQGLARVVDALEEHGRLENTLFLVLADNGGCAEEYGSTGAERPDPSQPVELRPMGPEEHQQRMQPAVTRDGRPVRTGKGVMPGPDDTYIAYGKGWANASNTPFRLYKHWVHEGGIASPLVVHWPAGIDRRGELEHQPAQLVDVMATFLDVAGVEYPEEYAGHAIQPLEGVSLAPAFAGETIEREALYWEHEGNRAIRVGNWKLVARGKDGPWELYDLKYDRTERLNLATDRPELAEDLATRWTAWAERSKVLPLIPYWQPPAFSKERRFELGSGARLARTEAPNVSGAPFRVSARVETADTDGVVVAQGGNSHGWSVYLVDRVPHMALRRDGKLSVLGLEQPVEASFTLVAELGSEEFRLSVEGGEEASWPSPGLLTQVPLDGLEVGRDEVGAVGDYPVPSTLEAELEVVIEILD